MKNNEQSLRAMKDTIKCPNIHIMGVPRKRGAEKVIEEIIAEKFPNLLKNISLHILESQ